MSDVVVKDLSVHNYYAEIPHIVIESKRLSHTAYRLYSWYKKVCGSSSGQCYQSLKTVSEGCMMRRQSVIKSREELEEKDLISITEKIKPDGSKRVYVYITDIWKENNKYYTDKRKKKLDKENLTIEGVRNGDSVEKVRGVRNGRGESKGDTEGVKLGYSNKNPINKNSGKNNQRPSPRSAESKDRPSFSDNSEVETSKLDKFTKELAIKVKATVKKYSSTNRMSRARTETYAKCIRLLVLKSEFNKSIIKEVIEWYSVLENYRDKFTPKIRKSKDLYDNFDRIKEAMHRKEEDSDVIFDEDDFDARVEKNADLIEEVRTQLTKMGHDIYGPPPIQDTVDKALVSLGYSPSSLDQSLL